MSELFIGLMSGTSLDGVDGVLVDFAATAGAPLAVRAHAHLPFEPALASELLALNASGGDELHRAALAANGLVRVYAQVVRELLSRSGVDAADVRAIGAHGQTVRHRPREFDGIGYTVQINNPAWLVEQTGIDVVADFRTRDVAAGGQGAPLVPAFHRAVFARPGDTVAVLNIGGISNLTALGADGTTLGFDCGPGNALMDHWCAMHFGEPYDRDGMRAARGTVDDALLRRMQADPYFRLPPPKSTGRDLFNPQWLGRMLPAPASHGAAAGLAAAGVTDVDVQATLTELTAWACAESIRNHAPGASEVLVCGGGAYNTHLVARLAARIPQARVQSTDSRGLPANQVEATAFAWLARAFIAREPGNLVAVTGAHGPRVLGALYPAR